MPEAFRFRAGQYLEVLHPDGPVPLSIASAPWRLPELHLHYRPIPGAPEAARMDELLAASERLGGGGTLEVSGPGGDVALEPPLPAPALIVAGGTGMAQAMSFIDAFDHTDPGAPVTVLWCVDRDEDFYLDEELERPARPWLRLVKIADPGRSEANRGLEWLRRHAGDLETGSVVVLSGGPAFVHASCTALARAGVARERMRSDVFGYAPLP